MLVTGITVLAVVAVFAGKDRDTEDGQKRVGKAVSNGVDLIVIYGVLILASLTLMMQVWFAFNVFGLRQDFSNTAKQFDNLLTEEVFADFSLHYV